LGSVAGDSGDGSGGGEYTVLDRAQDHYLLMAVGWDGHKRVHAPLIHVDIIDGKFWIQHDGRGHACLAAVLGRTMGARCRDLSLMSRTRIQPNSGPR
jgi:hypothetical protein